MACFLPSGLSFSVTPGDSTRGTQAPCPERMKRDIPRRLMTQNQKEVPREKAARHRRDREFMTSAGGLQFDYSVSPMDM